jgi:hypothetical protein
MENQFERVLFGGVLKDYRAECLPIQVAVAGKDAEPEFGQELLFNFLKVDKLARDSIGIEKFGSGKDLAQTIAESALARRNASGDSNCGHERSKTPKSKTQKPKNSKASNLKPMFQSLYFDCWSLGFGWSLAIGIWDFAAAAADYFL